MFASSDLPMAPPVAVRQAGIVIVTAHATPQYFAENHSDRSADTTGQSAGQSPDFAASPEVNPLPISAELPQSARRLPQQTEGPPSVEGTEQEGKPSVSSLASFSRETKSPGGRPLREIPSIDAAAVMADELRRNPPAAKPIGEVASFSMFGATARGRSFVLVIDRSQSMGGEGLGAIAAAMQELQVQLAALAPQQRVQVVAYNDSAALYGDGRLVPVTPAEQEKLVRFVGGIVASGATEHRTGILAALRLAPEVVFLLTDGGDPPLSNHDLRTLVEAAAGRTQIIVLEFGRGKLSEENSQDEKLKKLAQATGGMYRYVDLLDER